MPAIRLVWSFAFGIAFGAAPALAQPAPGPSAAPAWTDPSPHQVRFVDVAPGVRLEVLDWGGSGRDVDEPYPVRRGVGPGRLRCGGRGRRLLRDHRRRAEGDPEGERPDQTDGRHHAVLESLRGESPPVSAFWRMAAAPMIPPIPIDSTALLGINISAPFSFSPS